MTHYLKTYKRLENIGIFTGAELGDGFFKYDRAYLLSAIPEKKKSVRNAPLQSGMLSEKHIKSWRFNRSLSARLGVNESIQLVVGSPLQLTAVIHDNENMVSSHQTKLHLCLLAAKLYHNICSWAPQKVVDPYHFLGCLFISPCSKPLFIACEQFLNTDSRYLNIAIQSARQSFSLRTLQVPHHNTLRLLKFFSSRGVEY